ncbi:LysR family transcriptional regulator [Mitsuaria sp. 7]|uniref:LysR family transcriptional regulator n=1 Tax=Mitsuaria sp. 7 TaxID=1658665 RepID=UPI0007DDC0DB|nr:LysR family transcriptional regulator [Mitsuaria sp. 7]ANH67984.1 LysR family transcriptional regulator [Mitsuaria sp. 7]
MDRMQAMNAFVVVAETQNFAAAARRLGTSPATISRAIAGLEERLGVKLVLRTTRSVRLTDVGQRYLDDVRLILAKVSEAHESAGGTRSVMRGHLNVTAPAMFGVSHVMPCIAQYLAQFPAMTVSGYFLDRVVDLVEEGIDVAVRIGGASVAEAMAIPVGSMRRVLCASPDYLAARGRPDHPAELADHAIISAQSVSPDPDWTFRAEAGPLSVRVSPALAVTSNDAAVMAATMGAGITRLFHYQAAPQLADGRLEVVLAEHEEAPWPIHVVHAGIDGTSPKVRAFVDLLVQHLTPPGAV